ncbi:MAG: NAD(P)-dependent oxidoreductase [Alphaproteobacteria bacterium]|nr:NAD(P)-dependent oxidoreductase [Alphaproteobacteria bacterium]
MKILITGHKGYLGQEFLARYGRDYDIVGFDLLDGFDIADADSLALAMRGCDQVVHLAAIPKPVEDKSLGDYLAVNVRGTENVLAAAVRAGVKRVVYASSTTVYGIEGGIPFQTPITESQPVLFQYAVADKLNCRECDLSYHFSKVMAEQMLAWYGLNRKIQTVSLRFGPIGKVFLGTSVSDANAAQAISLVLNSPDEFWYEPFSIVDDVSHIDITKAKRVLDYAPEPPQYTPEQIYSTLANRYSTER